MRNSFKKTAFVLTSLVCLTVISLTTFHYQQNKKSSQDVSSETPMNKQLTGDERKQYEKKISQLQNQVDATENEMDLMYKMKTPGTSLSGDTSKDLKNDPAVKSYRRAQFKEFIDELKGPIIKELDLSAEDSDKLKDLFVDCQMGEEEIQGEYTSLPSPKEMVEMSKRELELKEEYEDKIKSFLGEQNYKKYTELQDIQDERETVDHFNHMLDTGDQISEEQQKKLTNLMYGARKELMSSKGYDNFGPEVKVAADGTTTVDMEKITQKYDQYLEVGRNILSASQLEQFKKYLNQQLDSMEMSLKQGAHIITSQSTQK